MAKKLVNSFLLNRIYYATIKKDGTMGADRVDLTDDVVQAMFYHMEKQTRDTGKNKYYAEGFGMIEFTPEEDISKEERENIRRNCGEKKESEEN
jgi:hypothetical protein